MLTLRYVFNDLMLLLGYDNPDNADPADRYRVMRDIQSALQCMQNAGEDYYGREPLTLALAAGTAVYHLDQSVQTVLNQGRLSGGQMLSKLNTRAQYMQFGPLFLGQLANGVTPAQPLALFAPTPDQSYTAILDVIRTPPLYTMAQLCGTSPEIPVPHQYTESIFLPLCRWNLMSHPKWYKAELRPQVQAEYERAISLLTQADPRRPKPADSSPDALDRAKAAARTAARDAYNASLAQEGA
jgi:hypothetical protein